MEIRLPWILSRRRLFTALILDSALFLGLNYGFFWHFFGHGSYGSTLLMILWPIWLLSSYVSGRYQGVDLCLYTLNPYHFLKSVWRTALVAVFSTFVSLICLSFLDVSSMETLHRSTVFLYIGLIALLSLLVQYLLRLWLRSRGAKPYKWYFLGKVEGYNRLLHHLKWKRLPAELTFCSEDLLSDPQIDFIVVEDISSQSPSILKSLLELRYRGRVVLSRQDWCELILQRFPSEYLDDSELLKGEFFLFYGTFQARLKRLGDVLLSTLLLVFAIPIIVVLGLFIKIEDGGPIFYSQIRSGFNGIPYKILKLRSMRVDAESDGIQWVQRLDYRVTRIGSFLRRTRLDELPQLWCVFTGRMSLIGPRPERPEFDEKLEKLIPHYGLRYRIKPGLSGWAQVNYAYGASIEDAANKLSYDLYYLRNFSFWLDLLILIKTIRLVLNAKGALPSAIISQDRFKQQTTVVEDKNE